MVLIILECYMQNILYYYLGQQITTTILFLTTGYSNRALWVDLSLSVESCHLPR
jgi:hypothetical protein